MGYSPHQLVQDFFHQQYWGSDNGRQGFSMYVPFSQSGAKLGTLSNPQNHRGVVGLYFSEGIGGGPPYGKSLYIILRGYVWVTKIPKNLQRTPAKYHEYTVRGTPPYPPLVPFVPAKSVQVRKAGNAKKFFAAILRGVWVRWRACKCYCWFLNSHLGWSYSLVNNWQINW